MVLWLARAVESAGEEVKAAEVAEARAKQAVSAAAASSNPFADDAVDAAVAGGESSGLDEAERALQVEKRRREAREREEAVTVATEALAAAGERKKRLTQMQSAVGQARGSVWDLMQRRVAVFVAAAPMNGFTVEQFLDLAHGLERFTAIGEAFSGGESLGLRTAMKLKGKSYLTSFHRERLDELRMRLETEMWKPMPLASGAHARSIPLTHHLLTPLYPSPPSTHATTQAGPSPTSRS